MRIDAIITVHTMSEVGQIDAYATVSLPWTLHVSSRYTNGGHNWRNACTCMVLNLMCSQRSGAEFTNGAIHLICCYFANSTQEKTPNETFYTGILCTALFWCPRALTEGVMGFGSHRFESSVPQIHIQFSFMHVQAFRQLCPPFVWIWIWYRHVFESHHHLFTSNVKKESLWNTHCLIEG